MSYGKDIPDKRLAELARAGDRLAESALVQRYAPLAEGLSRGFFLAGGDADDLKQIAMIALLEEPCAPTTRSAARGSPPTPPCA